MRWQSGRRSTNIQDRRGRGGMIAGGGIGAVVIAIIAMLLGIDPDGVDQSMMQQPAQEVAPGPSDQFVDDPEADFIAVVLGDTEDTWDALFRERGMTYAYPGLVLFEGVVQSGCGVAPSAVGPFYCPQDRNIYLDLDFFRELSARYGAPGDFARAYVVAHEVGHHVQTLTGIESEVRTAQAQVSEADANALQVRMELQADCLAGVWAHHADEARQILEPGDIEEALNAAAAIGDDTLQQRSQGVAVPETFTHGTSAQRTQWFTAGYQTGDPDRCNTFAA